MRQYILVLLLLCLLALCWQAYQTEKNHLVSISILTLIILVVGFQEARWLQGEWGINKIAHILAGENAGHLHCQRLSETMTFAGAEEGHVQQDPKTGELSGMLTWQICHDFGAWLRSDKTSLEKKYYLALHVIDHESVHLTKNFDESSTECHAMALDAKIAENLGADPMTAAKMATLYRANIYPSMPAQYTRMDCATGIEK